ncbi:hypothetical protein CROQUDRAFT_649746 [Cronartium quercuum f. sp. fusiforme G11]|uniref:Uncharacterized protein n=1 Tax=Cronartium quercuum f. sp. fusiforme G11 TaxID=708437 RepID=A0A9P6NUU6_9BASI|nr:hypothetical protein CROQUDRAFT_649746 [Cronartium quercuum f. sp. fusiforme G11]
MVWLRRRSPQDSINFKRNYSRTLQFQSGSSYTFTDSSQDEGETHRRPRSYIFRKTKPYRPSLIELDKSPLINAVGSPHLNLPTDEADDTLEPDETTSVSSRSLTAAIATGHFELAVKLFERLSARKRSKLATQTYNSLFNLAASECRHETDSIDTNFGSDISIHSTFTQMHQNPSSPDYVSKELRIAKVENMFHSIGREFSVDQRIHQLEVSIHAAALRMRDIITSPDYALASPSFKFQTQFRESQDRISEIICRLPKLNDVANITADDLAYVIPFPILGFYARFLALFHQPGQPLKMMRKVFYAYLIGRRRSCDSNENSNRRYNHTDFSDVAGIETGAMIMNILRNKVHHRMSALKLAIRMITKGNLYPDQCNLFRLLRRMFVSKPEWDSVVRLQSTLEDPAVAGWLYQQIALIEAESGRVQRVFAIARNVLYPHLQFTDLNSHGTLDLAIFTHAIQAVLDRRHCTTLGQGSVTSDLQEAARMREKMLERGLIPAPELDDIILRAVYQAAKQISDVKIRHNFLQMLVTSLFPRNKVVRMTCPDIGRQLASHPGKSVEAFRLMRWLMRWNELKLALMVFQSMSRYGYITSLGALPQHDLKRLLDKALACHPEVGAELYQHISMSGYDTNGIFFKAFKKKAIQMADVSLAVYLLKIMEERSSPKFNPREVTRIIACFARRRPTPGNMEKTLKLFGLVWQRWKPHFEVSFFELILSQLKKIPPIKLQTRPQLTQLLESTVACLSESGLRPKEASELKDRFTEYIAASSLTVNNHSSVVVSNKLACNWISQLDADNLECTSKCGTLVALLSQQIRALDITAAKSTLRKAIDLDILIPAPHIGVLLNMLVDKKAYEEVAELNKLWRGMSWKFRKTEKGDDKLVIEAIVRMERQLQWQNYDINLT